MVVLEAGMLHLWRVSLGWCCCLSCNVKDMVSYYNTVHIDPGQNWDKRDIPARQRATEYSIKVLPLFSINSKI